MTVIDADGLILGRLASNISKRLLSGENVIIVNAEKSVISGSKVSILGEYKSMVSKGSKEKGPHFPKRPDRILKRTIRGMLPYKQKRGRNAYSRLRVYIGAPNELQDKQFETIESAKATRLSARYIQLGELSKKLGASW